MRTLNGRFLEAPTSASGRLRPLTIEMNFDGDAVLLVGLSNRFNLWGVYLAGTPILCKRLPIDEVLAIVFRRKLV